MPAGLSLANPRSFAIAYRGFTPALAVRSQEPAMATLMKDKQTEQQLDGMLHLQLMLLSKFLNLKQGLTEEHVDFVVDKILTEYKWFRLADIAVVIDRIKSGHYGNFYENLNATKLMDIFRQYDIERNEELERMRIEENEVYKGELKKQAAKLPYHIEDGRIVMDRPPDEQQLRRRAETLRMQQVKERTMALADKIRLETGCTPEEAITRATIQIQDAQASPQP